MSTNVEKLVEKNLEAFNELKETVNALESKHDVLSTEKLARIEKSMDEIQEQMDALATAKQRPGSTEQKSATETVFDKFVRKGDRFLNADEMKTLNATGADQGDGAVTVPEVIDYRIMELRRELSPMRSIVNVFNTSSDNATFLYESGDFEAVWVAEEADRPTTANAKINELAIGVHEIYAEPKATRRLLEDSAVDLQAWINRSVANSIARKENLAFLVGDGVGKPKGLLTGAGTATQTTIGVKTTAAATGVSFDDIIDSVYGLNSEYLTGASFMVNKLFLAATRKIKNNQGDFIWSPNTVVGQPQQLFGHNMIVNPDMAAPAAGNIAFTFGDHRAAYTIVDRPGAMIMIRDEITQKQYIKFYHRTRVGGAVTDGNAVVAVRVKAA